MAFSSTSQISEEQILQFAIVEMNACGRRCKGARNQPMPAIQLSGEHFLRIHASILDVSRAVCREERCCIPRGTINIFNRYVSISRR